MSDLTSFLGEVATAAGRLAMSKRGGKVHLKARGDLVTEADKACEEFIIRLIQRRFPQAGILAEESGESEGIVRERFVIDPIDGTTNFAHGYPMFCVSIAYEYDGNVRAAAIYAPAFDELFCAEAHRGSTLNGFPISVSPTPCMEQALLCTGFSPVTYTQNAPFFNALYRQCLGVRHDGSAALNLAFVAAGRFDAYWEFGLKPWDYAAGGLIVREAGGAFSRYGASQQLALTAASNEPLAEPLIAALLKVRPLPV